jgi:hypothetical protein
MKAYPDVRAAKPSKWFWLVNLIPTVQVWASVVMVGFWHQPRKGEFNPVLRYSPRLEIRKKASPHVKRVRLF